MIKQRMIIYISITISFFISCSGPIPNEELSTRPQTINEHKLDTGLSYLANQIVESLIDTNMARIAVIEFSDLHGNTSALGKYISEELITRLFRTEKFHVVERHLLNKIIKEHELNVSGFVDESTAKEIGMILGADSIVSGTVADLGDDIKVNARLISTETGSIFSAASVTIIKDDTVIALMSDIGDVGFVADRKDSGKIKTDFKSGDIFYRDDFSGYRDGESPKNWFGTEHFAVQTINGQKVFKSFEPGPAVFTIPQIVIPENFSFKWAIRVNNSCPGTNGEMKISIGNLNAGGDIRYCDRYYAFINESEKKIKRIPIDVITTFELLKEENIIKLLINGHETIISRYPAFSKNDTIIINLGETSKTKGRVDLIFIEGRAL